MTHTSLSVSIMAHPSRRPFVDELLTSLDRDAEVVWDRRNDRWDTGSRALAAYDPSADYHLVVQDDAIVCRDLVTGTERALNYLVETVSSQVALGLYMGRRYKREARMQARSVSWFTMPLYWGVAVVLPTSTIDDIVTWGERNGHIENYDLRIGEWLRHHSIRTWYPWPSFVDHRLSPSLVPERGSRGRYAARFLGADVSALDFDPTGKVTHNLHLARGRSR